MHKLRSLLAALVFFVPAIAMACPGCVGSGGETRDLYVVYVIMGFIALVYIPFFLLYRTIIKNRGAHMIGRNDGDNGSTQASSAAANEPQPTTK